MGEPEALLAIRNKCVTIDNKRFAVEKQPHG